MVLFLKKQKKKTKVYYNTLLAKNFNKRFNNLLSNKHRVLIYLASQDTDGMLVADLLDPDLHCWRRELITSLFHTDDAEAICSIPLSHRQVPDILLWMYNKNGRFSAKSAYRVAVQIQKGEEWIENSSGCAGK